VDYKKITIYLLIVIAIAGYWYVSRRQEEKRQQAYTRFADVYASTVVMAELYRNEPDRFFQARDSIYTVYHYSRQSVDNFLKKMKDREEDWSRIWADIKRRVDTLTDYYMDNPIEHFDSIPIDTTAELLREE